LLEQHSESYKIWSAFIKIKAEGKSLIMKFDPEFVIFSAPGICQSHIQTEQQPCQSVQ